MLVQEIMRRPVFYTRPDETVAAAARKMREANIGFLPVCDVAGHPIGALTDRDIAIRCCGEGRSPRKTHVGDIMSREVICCRSADDITIAESMMSSRRKSRVMVMDGEGKLIGVISLADLAVSDNPRTTKTLRDVSQREVESRGSMPPA
jgi:CBS domain-containing protein